MHTLPSLIADVDIMAMNCDSIAAQPLPAEAVPFSVSIHNRRDRTIALVGVRFDMTGPRAEKYSVVHYADMLRDPAKATLKPGASRVICAEPSYTSGNPTTRGRMNLDNLRRMLRIEASLDCVAFDDGRFEGPDTRGAFDRLNAARAAELALSAETPEVLNRIAADANEDRIRVAAARKLLTSDSLRPRIELWRP